MTPKERATMQQALEALELMYEWLNAGTPSYVDESKEEAITALREALAKQAEQEPVATYSDIVSDGGLDPRNAAPVRTKDLTDDEIEAIMVEQGDLRTTAFARAVIAADREKNK